MIQYIVSSLLGMIKDTMLPAPKAPACNIIIDKDNPYCCNNYRLPFDIGRATTPYQAHSTITLVKKQVTAFTNYHS